MSKPLSSLQSQPRRRPSRRRLGRRFAARAASSVSGEGEAPSPDVAVLTLSVLREAKTAREALDANNDAMAAVIAAMKSVGIADATCRRRIQISPRYNYSDKPDGGQTASCGLPGLQHALGPGARHRQDRRDSRQGGDAGGQPGRRISFTNENPTRP